MIRKCLLLFLIVLSACTKGFKNQKILSNRNDLIFLRSKLSENNSLNKYELTKLRKLSKKYKIKFDNEHKMEIIDKLLLRVEIIPNSIVLFPGIIPHRAEVQLDFLQVFVKR